MLGLQREVYKIQKSALKQPRKEEVRAVRKPEQAEEVGHKRQLLNHLQLVNQNNAKFAQKNLAAMHAQLGAQLEAHKDPKKYKSEGDKYLLLFKRLAKLPYLSAQIDKAGFQSLQRILDKS